MITRRIISLIFSRKKMPDLHSGYWRPLKARPDPECELASIGSNAGHTKTCYTFSRQVQAPESQEKLKGILENRGRCKSKDMADERLVTMSHRRVHDLGTPRVLGRNSHFWGLSLLARVGQGPHIPLILFESQNFLNVTGFFYFLKYSKFKMLEFLASTGCLS